jgi:hypothetical protein
LFDVQKLVTCFLFTIERRVWPHKETEEVLAIFEQFFMNLVHYWSQGLNTRKKWVEEQKELQNEPASHWSETETASLDSGMKAKQHVWDTVGATDTGGWLHMPSRLQSSGSKLQTLASEGAIEKHQTVDADKQQVVGSEKQSPVSKGAVPGVAKTPKVQAEPDKHKKQQIQVAHNNTESDDDDDDDDDDDYLGNT